MQQAKKIIGVDLRIRAVKVVEAEKGTKGNVLKKWGMAEIPSDLLDKHPEFENAKSEALKKILRDNKINVRDANVVIGGGETIIRKYSLLDTPPADVASAIKWKLAEEILFPIEEAIFDFYPIGTEEKGKPQQFIAACISKKAYLDLRQILKNAGINLVGISILPDVFKEVFAGEMQEKKDITSIIYMGKRSTNISFFRGGEFEFNRELQIGGENISQAMAGIFVAEDGTKIELTLEEAEKMKVENGIPLSPENYQNPANIPFVQLEAMVRPALEKIQEEVSRTFEYYKGQSGESVINKIILTGGSALTPNLAEFLSEGFGIPVTVPRPIAELDPRLIAAFGAATGGLGRINLLPDEVKYQWKTLTNRLLKPYIVFPAVAGLLTLIYLLMSLYLVHLQSISGDNTKKQSEYAPLLTNFDIFQKAVQEEENRKKMLKAYGKTQKELPNILAEISRLVPANVKVDMLTLSLSSVFIKGTAFEKGGAAENVLAQFALSLSFSPILYEVRLNQAGKNENYKTPAIDFEITAKIKEK